MCGIIEDPTGMKSVTMDENKSRVFDVFYRTAVRVVEDGTISNRQSEHFDISMYVTEAAGCVTYEAGDFRSYPYRS